jgi:hypothetical protein
METDIAANVAADVALNVAGSSVVVEEAIAAGAALPWALRLPLCSRK